MERVEVDGLGDDCTVVAWDAPGAGHVVNIEAPEAFDEAVRGFLSDLPEGA